MDHGVPGAWYGVRSNAHGGKEGGVGSVGYLNEYMLARE